MIYSSYPHYEAPGHAEKGRKDGDRPSGSRSRNPRRSGKNDFSKVVIEPLFADQVDFETFSKSDFRAVKVLDYQAALRLLKIGSIHPKSHQ